MIEPLQVVPPSIVKKLSTSTPEATKVGAVPPGHLTAPGQVTFVLPFVRTNIKEQHIPVGAGLAKVKVVELAMVAVTIPPKLRSMVLDPEMEPRTLTVSEYFLTTLSTSEKFL